jgi:hypothetical protein
MKVKAIRLGFYDQRRRREGDVFHLSDPEHFSKNWMVKVEKSESKRESREKEKSKAFESIVQSSNSEVI